MQIQPGDWFLLPYAGPERERLVRAVRQASLCDAGQWHTRSPAGSETITLLTSCERVSIERAEQILQEGHGAPRPAAAARTPRGRAAFVLVDGYAGRRALPCRVIGTTRCKARIEVDQPTRLPRRLLEPGQQYLVPRTAIRCPFPPKPEG